MLSDMRKKYTTDQKFGEQPLNFVELTKNWRSCAFYKTNLLANFETEGLPLFEEFYHLFNYKINPLLYKFFLKF